MLPLFSAREPPGLPLPAWPDPDSRYWDRLPAASGFLARRGRGIHGLRKEHCLEIRFGLADLRSVELQLSLK